MKGLLISLLINIIIIIIKILEFKKSNKDRVLTSLLFTLHFTNYEMFLIYKNDDAYFLANDSPRPINPPNTKAAPPVIAIPTMPSLVNLSLI